MKRYRDYATYLKEIFGERVQKISLDAGLHCPNRDGTLSERGCIFCDKRGTGAAGQLHSNFKLVDGGLVALFSVDELTLIDMVVYPWMATDTSYGRFPDGSDTFCSSISSLAMTACVLSGN